MPTSGSSLHLSVPKLDRFATKWSTWHLTIETVFKACGLMDIVDGTNPQPSNPLTLLSPSATAKDHKTHDTTHKDTTTSIKEWQKTNASAHALIINSVKENHLSCIGKLKTSKQQWDTLVATFEPCTNLICVDQHQALGEVCCAAGGDVCTHFDRFLKCHREYTVAGHTIDNQDLVQLILLSILSKEY